MQNNTVSIVGLMMLIILAFASCTNRNEALLSEAQRVVYHHPDSTLIFLDSISDPQSMSDRKYMEYILTKVQAKYKLYQDVTGDTIIFRTKEYFEKKKLPEEAALAYFYSGCVHRERKEGDGEAQDFMKARRWAAQTEDNNLKGMVEYNLGWSYDKANLPDSALVYYKKSLFYCRQTGNADSLRVDIIQSIADAHILKNETDSGMHYYNMGLRLAKKAGAERYVQTLTRRMGVSSVNIGKYDSGKTYLLEALSMSDNIADSAKIYNHLLEMYSLTNQPDSVKAYVYKIENKYVGYLENLSLCGFYGRLSQMSENMGDYRSALKYTRQQYECRIIELDDNANSEKLNMSKMHSISENEKQLLVLDYEMREMVFLVAIVLTCMFLIITLLLAKLVYDRNKQMKQKTDGLLTQTNNLLYLNQVYQNMRVVFVDFEKELDSLFVKYKIKEQLDGYKHIHSRFKNMHKVAEESLSQPAIDYLKGQGLDESLFSTLKSSDLVFLSLLMCGHKHKDIAIVLGVDPHTLQMRKSRLRGKLEKNGHSGHLVSK